MAAIFILFLHDKPHYRNARILERMTEPDRVNSFRVSWEDDAVEVFQKARIMYAPSKASNAGGVAVSDPEMSQNSVRISWIEDDPNKQLGKIMSNIRIRCIEHGREGESINYVRGANIAGFIKAADAMLAYGVL